jgi:hypothetical protein
MNRSMLIMMLVVAGLAVGVPFASAATGADGGSGTSAWVSASQDLATAGHRVDLTGCGYEVKPAQIRVTNSAGYAEIFGVGMWSTGCFSGYFYAPEAGTYTIDVYQSQRNTHKPMLLKASTTLSVQ